MFSEDEVKFIEETATKDLLSVNQRIDSMINEMARLGKQLADIKIVQARLQRITQAIKDAKPEQGCC